MPPASSNHNLKPSENQTHGLHGVLTPPFQYQPPNYEIPPDVNENLNPVFQLPNSQQQKGSSGGLNGHHASGSDRHGHKPPSNRHRTNNEDPQQLHSMQQDLKKQQRHHYKTYLYQLITQQLREDGLHDLSRQVMERASVPPYQHLNQIGDTMQHSSLHEDNALAQLVRDGITYRHERRFNLDIGDSGIGAAALKDTSSREQYSTRFITTHKGPCTCAAFSADGAYVVTGSQDSSIKLLSVEKMMYHTQTKAEVEDYALARPVLRTYYDHSQEINDVVCHPREPIICSASRDYTLKFFNYSRMDRKRAFKHIQETHNVRTVGFHPGGEYLLVGTDHHIVRLYNMNNGKCYISSNPAEENHFSSVNQARFSQDGKIWATASTDGSIKVWDGTNSRVMKTVPHAHGQGQVYTVQFSRNSRYLLTNGDDGLAKLWDLRTWKQLHVYRSPQFSSQSHRHHVAFSFDEKRVIGSHESKVVVWDTQTTNLLSTLEGHNRNINSVSCSPMEPVFMTCSDDSRARFFCSSVLDS